ncbi:response regulator transcription factor [Paenalcaligenes hominis]|uniref:response regulator transcription factor n=1 Tax=Paenalcaligenes hominis TaxID=643674 RepID=UPI0035243C22
MTTIIVLDPHPILRLGLIQLLKENFEGTTVKAEDYHLLTEQKKPASCDLIVYTLGSEANPTNQLTLLSKSYTPRFILLLAEGQPSLPPGTCKNYPLVRGLICKNSTPEIIQASIRLVLAGGTCFPHYNQAEPAGLVLDENVTCASSWSTPTPTALSTQFLHKEAQLLGLTIRQYEVLVLLGQGLPLKSIAKELDISVATAKSHTETLYQRLKVHNSNAAVYTAIARGATLGWGPAQ